MNNAFEPRNTEFIPESFFSPSEEYEPVYAWFWNGPVTDEISEKQLLEMLQLGIHSFYVMPEPMNFRPNTIPTITEPAYLTDDYFKRYEYVIRRASELGMKCWIYDEGGWPSGGAAGRVMYDHPEYARRTLDKRSVTLSAGEPYVKRDGDALTAFHDGTMINEGDSFDTDTEIVEYYSKRVAFEKPGFPDVPDATRSEATDYFIKLTHERYKKFLSKYFGNTVTAIFTDEPLAPTIPMRAELVKEYEKLYGESPLPYLPEILGDKAASGDSLRAKIRWFDLASKKFTENFLLRCKKWSNENGLAFTGHVDRDDEPRGAVYGKNFHVMRSLRAMDVPGIDVIWRQIFPNKNGNTYENRFFPRYASSAAAQNGTRFAMTETFGVYGNGLTFEDMRFILGFQAIRGVTLFNSMKISYERRGIWLAGELPSFDGEHACYEHLSYINAYMRRLSYVLTRGERVASTALYYPISNFWADLDADKTANEFDSLGFEMEARGVDFDIVDDDVILSSDSEEDGVISSKLARYTEIVIPSSAIIPDAVRERLSAFAKGGGRVLYSTNEATPCVIFPASERDIVAQRRRVSDGELICLYNQSTDKKTLTINETPKNAYLIDITEGCIKRQSISSDGMTLSLESGECTALYLTEKALPALDVREPKNYTELTDFKLKIKKRIRYGEMYIETERLNGEAKDSKLGCWADAVGKDFSGSCSYLTSFNGTDCDIVLDLGEVRHSAEVLLNGKSLGVRIMKPFRFIIKKELMHSENLLEIIVTNTMANQQQYTKAFDKWATWQLSPYTEKQNKFDKDSLDSGLYGPVTLALL